MQKFERLPIAGLLTFTLGVVVSGHLSHRYVASIVVVFLAATLLWTVGKRYSRYAN